MSGLATLLFANCLLLGASWILHGGIRPHWFALEAGILVGLFLLLPRGRASTVLAWIAGPAVVAVAVLSLGDTTARMALARPLNLYLDVRLVDSVGHMLDGSLGAGWGPVVLVGIGLVAIAAAAGLAMLLSRLPRPWDRPRAWVPGVVVVAVGVVAVPTRWVHPSGVVLALPATQLVREQSVHLRRMWSEQERFAGEMAASPAAYRPEPGLLEGLGGRDVILAFLESYGVSALTDPRYEPTLSPRLDAMEEAFREEGIHVASGLLLAPSQGGMSWLGHGSVLSGLWLDNQLRYDLLMASDRNTLVDDFEAAGYRTAALMPAVTLAWPEGDRLGYEEIFAFADIDYAGPPLNWVTMPDQFTWSFLETGIRDRPDERPLFAELALISGHAPWTPILEVEEDWAGIGDGAVFERWRDAGETPEELWRDGDRVREHYALAVGYAVDVLTSYTREYLDGETLLIAMGDHQPAPLITGEEASRAVPVHVMATSPELLQPFLRWGFQEGVRPTIPTTDDDIRRMDAFRHWFVESYSSPRGAVAQ